MAKITDQNASAAEEAVLPPTDQIDSPPQPDQNFTIPVNTEAAPMMQVNQEEYILSMLRAIADRQLLNGGTTTPLDTGLPNAQHVLSPHLGEQMPAYGGQAQYMGANNLYQLPFTSDMMDTYPIYSVNQNSASFPMSNNYLNASGSVLPFGMAQHPFNQAPNHQTSLSEMFRFQDAEPTTDSARHVIYGGLNPPPVYADEDPMELMRKLRDPWRVEYPSEEDLEGMQPTEDGFDVLLTIPEEEMFPWIPCIDHMFHQAKQQLNQPMMPPPIVTDTVIADHLVDSSLPNSLAALSEESLQNAIFDAYGLSEHERSVVEFAMRGATPVEAANVRVDHGVLSPEITTESTFLPQGQANTLSGIADMPLSESPFDPISELMRDPLIRLLLAIRHGNTEQSQDGSSSTHTP